MVTFIRTEGVWEIEIGKSCVFWCKTWVKVRPLIFGFVVHRRRILTRKWEPFILIPNQFCKKFAKQLQKNCKRIAKNLQKNLQNFCRFFADFLQLHILQKVLHFRPPEESVRETKKVKMFYIPLKHTMVPQPLSY